MPALVVASYLTVYLVWGSTYFFIKRSVATIPTFSVLAIRWTVGGVLLLAFAAVTGRLRRLPSLRELASAAVLGTLLLVLGNGLITAAERRVDSYIAALLASSSPIVVALFDRLLLRSAPDLRARARRGAGLRRRGPAARTTAVRSPRASTLSVLSASPGCSSGVSPPASATGFPCTATTP